MSDMFEKRVRAAAVAGWWTLLLYVGFLMIQWIVYRLAISVHPAWLSVVLVWPGHDLVVSPDYMVPGPADHEDGRFAFSLSDDLADAVGKTAEKAGGGFRIGCRCSSQRSRSASD